MGRALLSLLLQIVKRPICYEEKVQYNSRKFSTVLSPVQILFSCSDGKDAFCFVHTAFSHSEQKFIPAKRRIVADSRKVYGTRVVCIQLPSCD